MTDAIDPTTGLRLMNPDTMFDPAPLGFSHVAMVPAGAALVFLAGQGGGRPKGSFAEQVAAALASIATAMEAAGGDMAGVAKLTVYIVAHDNTKHRILIEAVKAAFDPRLAPTCTIVPLSQLGTDPEMFVEIEAVGVLPGDPSAI